MDGGAFTAEDKLNLTQRRGERAEIEGAAFLIVAQKAARPIRGSVNASGYWGAFTNRGIFHKRCCQRRQIAQLKTSHNWES